MLYAVLCYNSEEVVCGWSQAEDDAVMARLDGVHQRLMAAGKFATGARLMPTTAATTLRKSDGVVLDGPYAETKEQLLGFYLLDFDDLEDGLYWVRELTAANPGGAYELRPLRLHLQGQVTP